MLGLIRGFIREEDGMSTVEIVLIIAVLVGLAILFRNYIIDFVQYVLSLVFDKGEVTSPYDQSKPTPFSAPAKT
ncbi:MAG: hypothetical protein GX270_01000 [Clostridiaceae bacterium]|jgi:Flp pilus assembly pilin Flp|nr:hypothetical protein [Clostridiaceae bacterium]